MKKFQWSLTWVSREPVDLHVPVQRASSQLLLASVIQVQLPLCPDHNKQQKKILATFSYTSGK